MNNNHLKIIFCFFFFLVLFLPSVSAADYIGEGYGGNTAFGTFVQRHADFEGLTSIIFGWSGPVKNGTNEDGISSSALGISANGDVYVVTFGADLEDVIPPTLPKEEVSQPVPSSSIPSSIGGGGGSSHRDTYGLVTGDILTILIGGETHPITIDSVWNDHATLTVKSVPKKIDLIVGETKKLDITNTYPGTDVAITLDSVSDLRQIVITVEDLTQKTEEEKIAAEEVIQEQQQMPEFLKTITGAVAAIQTPQVQEAAKEVKQGITTATKWILLLNIALGILVGTGITAKKLQQRRIYNVFHQKTKQELIAEELKKVERYVIQAMREGYHYEGIKEQLLDVGWQEYEVDEVIVNAMFAEKQEI